MLEYKQKRNNGRTPFAGVYKFVWAWVCVCVWGGGGGEGWWGGWGVVRGEEDKENTCFLLFCVKEFGKDYARFKWED